MQNKSSDVRSWRYFFPKQKNTTFRSLDNRALFSTAQEHLGNTWTSLSTVWKRVIASCLPDPSPPHRSRYGANLFPAFPAVCFSNTTMFALKGWREECISVTSRPRPYDLGVSSLCFFSLALGSNPASTTAEGNTLRDAGETKQQESAWQQRGEPLTDLEHSSHAATWEINLDLAMGLMLRLMIKQSFYQYL